MQPTDLAHLLCLVRRIADQDHDAFAELHEELSGRLHYEIGLTTADRRHAAAIFAATFVEVWVLARSHVSSDTDVGAWIKDIVARRTTDRPSEACNGHAGSVGRPWWAAAVDSRDRHTQLALTALLAHRSVAVR